MKVYTHVSRINVDKAMDANGNKVWTEVKTSGVQIPTTLEDVRALLDKPEYQKVVKVKLNEQSSDETLTEEISVPEICKLLIDSIKLKVNGKATGKLRQGDGIDVDATLARIVTDPAFATVWRDRFTAALTHPTDAKGAKRTLAEEYLASLDDAE